MTIKCDVIGCISPAQVRGLCRKHDMRVRRHGTTESTRPNDWGSREKHLLYTTWCSIRRYRKREDLCDEWRDDFWAFAHEVKAQPEGARQRVERLDETKPLGPGNWYWREFRKAPEDRAQRAQYMREYNQRKRDVNPDYYKNADLKRTYGVTLEWYNQKLAEQGGNCAICKHPETTKIRGTVIRLAVDHCHDTGVARALLCKECNQAIGLMHHDPVRLAAAASYVTQYSNFSK